MTGPIPFSGANDRLIWSDRCAELVERKFAIWRRSLPINSPRAQHLWWDDQPGLWLALHGWADCDVADLDFVGLSDGKGNGASDGLRRESEFVHAAADLLTEA